MQSKSYNANNYATKYLTEMPFLMRGVKVDFYPLLIKRAIYFVCLAYSYIPSFNLISYSKQSLSI
jgi:hypothetical protein